MSPTSTAVELCFQREKGGREREREEFDIGEPMGGGGVKKKKKERRTKEKKEKEKKKKAKNLPSHPSSDQNTLLAHPFPGPPSPSSSFAALTPGSCAASGWMTWP